VFGGVEIGMLDAFVEREGRRRTLGKLTKI
jgi:hypothetical protein